MQLQGFFSCSCVPISIKALLCVHCIWNACLITRVGSRVIKAMSRTKYKSQPAATYLDPNERRKVKKKKKRKERTMAKHASENPDAQEHSR